MRWPTALDLFAGIGGLTAGLRAARFRVVGAVELDKLAARSYELNFPSVTLWKEDIRGLDPADVMEKLELEAGHLGLLAGCPPCQGFSTVRTRRGGTVRDSRNRLILDFLRFAQALRPKTLMMENVPGVADYYRFKEVVAGLRQLGYSLRWAVRDASRYAVPQRRKRLILVGCAEGEPNLPEPNLDTVTVRDVISGLPRPGLSDDPLHDIKEDRSDEIMSLIRRIPRDGGSRSSLGADQLACHQRLDGFSDVYGRMAWDTVAPTITGGCINPSKGRFLHPDQDRAITLREALVLQGFAPDFSVTLDGGKYAAAALVGNALPPPMVAFHAAALRPHALSRSVQRADA